MNTEKVKESEWFESIKDLYDGKGRDRKLIEIKEMNTEFVIASIVNGTKKYIIWNDTNALTKKHIVDYTLNKEEATVFESESDGDLFIPKINNPYDRRFFLEEKGIV